MDFIFGTITVLWLLEFLIFPSLNKSKTKTSSFSIILISIVTIVLINGLMYVTHTLLVESRELKILSLLIYIIGLILRYWSLILLGKNFSREVDAEENQELVSRGTYRFVRHPLYLGLYLLTIAVPLYSGNIIVFLLASVLMFKAISIRIVEEEKIMSEVLGERYTLWKEKRYKFIPFIY